MFCFSQHIVEEAMEIAKKMLESGANLVAIRSTGLFVSRNVDDSFIELHEFVVESTAFFIVQRAT